MANYVGKSIKDIVKKIENGTLILPAMQRNFVWTETKIYDLFDSLMRDYPIGTFLFWEIDNSTFNSNVFNKFFNEYKESRDKFYRGERATAVNTTEYQAVLDGQQRLTSLYLGISGVYKKHIKNQSWSEEKSFVNSYLCVDILFTPHELDEKYKFKFCFDNEIEILKTDDEGSKHYWVKVATIFNLNKEYTYDDLIDDIDKKNPGMFKDLQSAKPAKNIIKNLNSALVEKENINFYLAQEKDLPSVVEIFVRVNSGGEKLSACDLMLSVVSGIIPDTDIHSVLQDAITQINNTPKDKENGFLIEKETLLMGGLMFTGAESLNLSKKENYSAERLKLIFIDKWDQIIDSVKYTVKYIEELGFLGRKLSQSIILPIAYYFFLIGDKKRNDVKRKKCDFIFIRQWLIRSILKDVFMEGTGATLLQFRKLIESSKCKCFPYKEIFEKEIKHSLMIGDEQVENILNISYGDAKIIPIFSELSQMKNDSNSHVDHIWAYSILYKNNSKKLKTKFPSISDSQLREYRDGCNTLLNLQLLPSLINQSKSGRDYDEWIKTEYENQEKEFVSYKESHFIPDDKNLYTIEKVLEFWKARKLLLANEIKKAFPNSVDELITRHGLDI